MLINLIACSKGEKIVIKSDFCDVYTPFDSLKGFNKDIENTGAKLKKIIEDKEKNHQLLTSEEKLHKYFVDYGYANESTAEKKGCYNE